MAASKLIATPVTPSTWADLESLFESKGGPKYCWCMAWREMQDRSSADNAARRKALYERVLKRTPIGLLGYLVGEPVAWCSVAPRETFLKLSSGQDNRETGVWSVVCFFVRRDHRKEGVAAAMLEEAVKQAKKRGAKVVEGYPVEPDSPSYRCMGFVSVFREKHFEAVGRAGSRRHVMRREL
jgi:GNAT superfamily N-acetyltransferase